MQLDALQAVLRPRSQWEAMMLGNALVRAHFGLIFRAWWLASIPVFVVLFVLAWAVDKLWVVLLFMWWLKPWFDRIVLYVLSQTVFGEKPTVWQAVAALWRFGRVGLLRDLTWARLSPLRALLMPVNALEGLHADALKQRRRLIGGADAGAAIGLLVICIHFEIILQLAWIVLIPLLLPLDWLSYKTVEMLVNFFSDLPFWAELLGAAISWLMISLIEPFYAGAGFGLYLNRRTHLEAWDIEITLRRLQARLGKLAAVGAISMLLAWPVLAFAQSDAAATCTDSSCQVIDLDVEFKKPANEKELEQGYAQTLDDPLLFPQEQRGRWRRIGQSAQSNRPRMRIPNWRSNAPAVLLKWTLIALAIGFVVWLLWRSRATWLQLFKNAPDQNDAPPQITVEQAEAALPIPDDVPAAVRKLWQQGRQRAALALLYRAAVEALQNRLGREFPAGATESYCLRQARQLPDALSQQAFKAVVGAWQFAAYAQTLPSTPAFEQLVTEAAAQFWPISPRTDTDEVQHAE